MRDSKEDLYDSVEIRGACFFGFTGFDIGQVIEEEAWKERSHRQFLIINELQHLMEMDVDEMKPAVLQDNLKYELLLSAISEMRQSASYQIDACGYVVEKLRKALKPTRTNGE